MKTASQAQLKALQQEIQVLQQQLATTQGRLEETEAILQAIRSGEVDAIIVSNPEGEQVFTLQGADYVYQCLVEQMGEGAATVAEDGLILYANQQLSRLLHCSLNNLIGSYLSQYIVPQDQKSFQLLLQNIQDKRILTRELSLITATDKREIPVKLSLKKISAGSSLFNSIIVTDITESKIKEAAKISQILNSAIIVIKNFRLFIDGTLQIDSWLGGTQELFGYDVETITASPWLMTGQIFPEDGQQLLASLIEDIRAGRAGMISYRFRHPDQTVHWLSSNYVAEWHAEQDCWQGLEVITDITQLKTLEQQFYHAQRLESLGTLASGIAHDFNNILTPILGASQLLSMKLSPVDPQVQKLLGLLVTSTKRAIDLVKKILFFSRGIETEHTNLNLENVLKEVIDVVNQTFPKSIKIKLQIATESLWTIAADATQIHQVFMNLLINARDAMPEGGVLTIRADNRVVDERFTPSHGAMKIGRYVVVQVIDTGVGIDASLLDRIFDPFFTTKEAGKGTGLGLSTVMGILKSHGGFIFVSSHPGAGTTFELFFPAIDALSANPSPTLTRRQGKGELILIADDEVSVREITQTSLETYHYRTLIAKDGLEAITLYREHQQEIQVVLIDMMMPNVTGTEAIRAIQRVNPLVKIIATSGLLANGTLATEAGASAFLLKPYSIDQLLQLLEGVLPSKQAPDHPEILEVRPDLPPAPAILSRADLADLSPDWLRKIYEAAYRVDTEEMLDVIAQLPSSQAGIAQALKEIVLNFDTEKILEITCPSEDA